MNLELDLIDMYVKINKRNFTINKNTLLKQLVRTFEIMDQVTGNLSKKSGLEKNDSIGLTNPLLWELGHTLHFWEHLILKNIGYTKTITKDEVYNSFLISRNNRFKKKNLLDLEKLLNGYKNVIEFIYLHINNYDLNKVNSYLFRLGQLHLEMHNESFIFTNQLLEQNIFGEENYNKNDFFDEDPLDMIEMVKIDSGMFFQGTNIKTNEFYFDNEAPLFYQFIKTFEVSKYCITNYQFLQFVENDGYTKKEYWCNEGWSYIKKKKLFHPIYWIRANDIWCEKIFDKVIILRNNNPVIHISWYEAMAYCKWKNCRLLYEKEWEYLAGLDKNLDQIENANLNYGKEYNCNSTVSVLQDKSKNNLGIVGLFGNCWEWCLEPIYPYDGFVIDPVYREMSYPHFGYKRICRGGSWAVPDFLINKHYRNAQSSDCCHQYIGFRIARSI